MKQGKRKGSKRIKKEDMLASVVEFFNQDRKRAFNYKQVAHGVGATTTPQKQMVFQLLEGMAEQNFLIEVSPGKYKANSRGTEVIGRFERRVNGKNHVITDDDESIFIAERNAMHAMDGDRVRVLVYAKRRGHVEVYFPNSSVPPITLQPAEQVTYSRKTKETKIYTRKDSSLYHIWAQEKLLLSNCELTEVIEKLGAWYNVTMTCTNTSPAPVYMTLTVRTEPLKEILQTLKSIAPIDYRFNNDTVYIEHKPNS